MGGKIQNRRKSSKRPKTNASINACKIDPEYDTIMKVAIYQEFYCKFALGAKSSARSGLPNPLHKIPSTLRMAAYQTVYCHSM